jgi:hypothetical protein
MVQYLVETAGLPARVIRGAGEVEEIRRQQAEANAAAQQQQAQMQEAEVANKVAPFIKAQAQTAPQQ